MIAVGSAYGIHIVNHYYHKIDEEGAPDKDQRIDVIIDTLRAVGLPVVMAGITTMVGFGSLATSEVLPMRDFGIFTAIGVAVALVVALVLIPAMLMVAPNVARRKKRRRGPKRRSVPRSRSSTITTRAAFSWRHTTSLGGASTVFSSRR